MLYQHHSPQRSALLSVRLITSEWKSRLLDGPGPIARLPREEGCLHLHLQGQRVGEAPVFDGVCARCGQLFYGHVNRATGRTVQHEWPAL